MKDYYNYLVKYLITSPENYKEYVKTGDSRYLNDTAMKDLKSGDRIVISWEGGEKEIEVKKIN